MNISIIKKISAFFRVRQWLHVLGLVFLGHLYCGPRFFDLKALSFSMIVGFFYLAHGYSLNNIFDNQTKTSIPKQSAFTLSLCALILSLLTSAVLSRAALLCVISGHLFGMLYSAPPFRFKNHLFLDLIFNSLSFIPLFLIGYAGGKTIDSRTIAFSFIIFLYFLPVQLMHEMQDFQTDRAFKQKNTFQILKTPGTPMLLLFLLFIFTLTSHLFWLKSDITIGILIANAFFAAMLCIYIVVSKIFTKKIDDSFKGNYKTITRYISCIYGTLLSTAFYFNI